MLDDRSILVTGGTGSFGKALVREILARHKPRRLVIFSRDEQKQFRMAQELRPRSTRACATSSATCATRSGCCARSTASTSSCTPRR
jgi:FlaA1/EpsC-like NDP-sugar epimerase